ncbi:histidinol-phosphate transaminase [Sphingomonas sp. SUN039]|uniref:pyridoxal phosphate-dependent aminotransferase n=1 Tax=Sphingomonas sp. SUN039 TaxID=2937787 RepID=UPI002164BF71|nr:histidinol-phosphate transaminase [Sphingomonas sp. SUN039]UVO52981.1 histidinol-phosphate transaminase [Sphingomonas sp. SUN039]
MTAPLPKSWIMDIAPYIPGRSTGEGDVPVTKLSSNENPLGTSREAADAFAAHRDDLSRYPDASAHRLREAIAAHHDLDPERVIYGTGSDELLHLVAGAYAGAGDEVIYVRYGFAVYDIAARRVGATPVVAPDSEYGTDVDAILACVNERTRIIYVANPNNPTGTYTPRSEIARLHAALPGHIMLVLDQAYAEYLEADEDDGGLELARTAANVVVTRTFSKIHGLAAERIGWGYGPVEAIAAMHRIRAPFCCTTAGQEAAIAALGAADFITASRDENARWRAWFSDEIAKLGNAGLRAVPSKANFVLVLFEGALSAEAAYHALMQRGFIVRWVPGQGLPQGLRMTIGTEAETRGLIAALREVVEA